MSIFDLVYYAFWWGIGLLIVGLIVLPIASTIITVWLTFWAIGIGVVLAMAGYIVGIPWAIWHRIVDGEWPDGG